nr:hypothetical protein [Tanacetum cinerariifolium]
VGAKVMRRQLDPLDTLARSSLARDEEYDQILDDDFARASHDEETDLTFFPLAHSSYVIPYPFKGDSSLKYTQALDQTITPAELRITESLPLLDLSNQMDVLTALLTYYGTKMNSRYTSLVASKPRLREKLKRKAECVSELCSEVSTLEGKYDKVQRDWSILDQENRELRCFSDVSSEEFRKLKVLVVKDLQNYLALEKSKSQEYIDVVIAAEHCFNSLRGEISGFVSSAIESLVCRLLSIDEFNFTLARIVYLGITPCVEGGLRMGSTDAEFEEATQKVSNLFVGVEAELNKVVADLPSNWTSFLVQLLLPPFLPLPLLLLKLLAGLLLWRACILIFVISIQCSYSSESLLLEGGETLCFPLLPAPVPYASVTSYGHSHFGPSFPVLSAFDTSFFRRTNSPV